VCSRDDRGVTDRRDDERRTRIDELLDRSGPPDRPHAHGHAVVRRDGRQRIVHPRGIGGEFDGGDPTVDEGIDDHRGGI
jgi:hypothetical protein